jgi:hypothetical protein
MPVFNKNGIKSFGSLAALKMANDIIYIPNVATSIMIELRYTEMMQ